MKYYSMIKRHFCLILAIFLLCTIPQMVSATGQSQYAPYSHPENIDTKKSANIQFSAAEETYLRHKKKITMCVDPDWMPLEKIEDGVHVGMTADYTAIFQEQIPVPIVLVQTVNWLESIEYAKARKCDIFSLAMPTPERETYMDFTQPYLKIPLVMAARMDMPFIDDITSLNGFTLGVVKGYAFGEILRTRYPDMDIVDVASVDQGLQNVANGSMDGFIGTLATVGYAIQRSFPSELKVAGKFDERWQLGIATRNDQPLLRSIFEKVISSITRKQHQNILNRWISVKFVQGTDHTILWRTLLLVAVGLAFLLWRFYALRQYNHRLQEQNKEILAGKEALYFTQSAIDHSDDSAFWSAEDGSFVYVNEAACRSLGYSKKELMEMSVSDFDPNFPAEAWDEHWRDLREKGSIYIETTHKTKDGKIFPVEVRATFLEYGGKEFNCSFARDITARKQAQADMAAETERLAVTLRSIGDGVVTTDVSGNIVLLNKITEKLTGWSNDEAAGRPLAEVFCIINEQTREICDNPVTKVIDSGQIIGLANHTILIARDGTERSIADSGAPIMDADSNVIGVVLVFRDVTTQIRTERELLKVKKLESVGVLAGGIAHDFNNILAAILGNINLALYDDELPGGIKKLLIEAEKASLRAKDLTQQLLTFSKGGAPIKEVASLDDVIRDSANFVLHGAKVSCKFEIPEHLLLVDIDKGQISQVIQNIVLNASQATPLGGVITITCENISSGDISVAASSLPGMFVKISIQDEGIGMAANVVEKIFDPYFSTKQEGSGLGLAITHSIISKHGGYILAESSPGLGSTFTIYLPALEQGRVESKEVIAPQKTSLKAKILIMDDEEMVRNVAKAMLIKLGHDVELTENGDEAIECYQKAIEKNMPFDMVMVDLTIPGGMGGKEAAKEILSLDPKAKIIVSSGYSNDPVMAMFADFGFCAAIVKPYQLQELSKVIGQNSE